MTSRRQFLKTASVVTAGALVTPSALASGKASPLAAAAPASGKRIGLQTYSLGVELLKDLPNGLKRLAAAGYNEFELFGYNEQAGGFAAGGRDGSVTIKAADYKKACDDAGIKLVSSHLNPTVREYKRENFGQFDDFWKKAADLHASIGMKYMVQPSLPQIKNDEDAKVVCEVFNRAGEICNNVGIKWGYHNHSNEFVRVPKAGEEAPASNDPMARMRARGEYIEQLFLDNTDPDKVFFELDVYWAVMGQQGPCEWLRNNPKRFRLLHIKDRWIIGDSGMMNFPNIFKAGYDIGIEGWFVEVENGSKKGYTQFDAVCESAKYLSKASFV